MNLLPTSLVAAATLACAPMHVDRAASDVAGTAPTAKASPMDVVPTLTLTRSVSDEKTQTLAAWGKKLFFDPRFSRDGQTSCGTCHQPEYAFTDGVSTPRGRPGIRRNTPTLVNASELGWLFWDGRAATLEAQVLGPLSNPLEMNLPLGDVAKLVGRHYRADYERSFGAWPEALVARVPSGAGPGPIDPSDDSELLKLAFAGLRADAKLALMREARRGKQPEFRLFAARHLVASARDPESVKERGRWAALAPDAREAVERVVAGFARAVAAYERSLGAADAPFDRFARRLQATRDVDRAMGDDFGEREWRGFQLFAGDAGCIGCHRGPTFSDGQFHNTGLADAEGPVDLGRAGGLRHLVTDRWSCQNAFFPRDTESCRELPYLDARSSAAVGAFKTPTLRNVSQTAPYFHDGRFADLESVIDHYENLPGPPLVGHRSGLLRRFALSEGDRRALADFLRSLTSPIVEVR